jgi:two-component system, sensor histidine kinase and response regulator
LRKRLLAQLDAEGSVDDHEVEFVRKDGSHYWTLLSLKKINFEGKSATLGWFYDITRRREAEIALRESEKKLRATIQKLQNRDERLTKQAVVLEENRQELLLLNQQKNMFFSIIAHDLRGPFTTLLALSELLVQQALDLNKEKILRFANRLMTASQQVFNLTESLLEWSHLQMDKFEFAPETLVLGDEILKNVELTRVTAAAKNISINTLIDSELRVFADPDMTAAILRNLLSNAVKFSAEGSAIEIAAKAQDNQVQISVTDNGIGMSEQNAALLFRLDKTLSTTGTDGETGTGLGLHLCKELVEKQGGSITVTSVKNQGTSFRFCLPSTSQSAKILSTN